MFTSVDYVQGEAVSRLELQCATHHCGPVAWGGQMGDAVGEGLAKLCVVLRTGGGGDGCGGAIRDRRRGHASDQL
jgi:hypothetical protein